MPDLGWLLTDFCRRVPHTTCTVAISSDGLLVAASEGLSRDGAESLAAVGSGLASLLTAAAQLLKADQVLSNLTEMDTGFMFAMALTNGASILVFASRECDIGQVSFEMAELLNRVGHLLTPELRNAMPLHTT